MRAVPAAVIVLLWAVASVAAAGESTSYEAGPIYVHVEGDDPFPSLRHEPGDSDGPGDDEVWAHQDLHHVGVHVDGDFLRDHGVPLPLPSIRHEIDAEEMELAQHPVGPALEHASDLWADTLPGQIRHYIDFWINESGFKPHTGEEFWPLNTNDSAPPLSIWWYTWVDYDHIDMPEGTFAQSDGFLASVDHTLAICWLPTTARFCPSEIVPLLGDLDDLWYDLTPNVAAGYHFIHGEVSTEPMGDDDAPQEPEALDSATIGSSLPGSPGRAGNSPQARHIPEHEMAVDDRPTTAKLERHDANVQEQAVPPEAQTPPSEWPLAAIAALLLLALPIWLLYRKIRKEDALMHPTRELVFQTIASEPGINEYELARKLRIHHDTVAHHNRILQQFGYVEVQQVGRTKRLFKNGGRYSANQRLALSALRSPQKGKALEIILRNPGITQEDLRQRLGIAKSTANWHVKKLAEAGLVEEEPLPRGKRLHLRKDVQAQLTDELLERAIPAQ